ncbi:iron-containing alcohol dehydrogenase [Tessaracoccus sp. SD287]|uniref:1-propanol dehydrogenase PduQ n=1 Tax=Tessaracoccus sp. SD287 TaxID=2782008 RepID=UPI001A969FF2|nr:1-propanol dehydrogenase PduQ [Tessaracoccus sp. SD287]MBO1032270.1 iron-containing alcohol dehydrogenase [Tessaracoccus sp. SD287]
MTRFRIATTIHQGRDSLAHLALVGAKRVLVVTDPFMATTPVMQTVQQYLSGAVVHVFSQVLPDPTISQVSAGVEAYLDAEPDTVVALGGGSVLDTAKAICKVAAEHGDSPRNGLVAIPSTSGSGSEVTSFAVITSEHPHRKVVLVSDDMAPTMAILDPEVTRTLPASQTADTGMDAMSHALEAYVCTARNDFSDAFAEKASQLIFQNLEAVVHRPDDLGARERMHNAATMAAMAFENSGLGIVHSLSHALGSAFNKPHGRLNAVLMPAVMEFNAGPVTYGPAGISQVADRYAHIAHLLGLEASTRRNLALALCAEVRRLRAAIGIPDSLHELGIDRTALAEAIPGLAATALEDTCTPANPVAPTAEDLAGILRAVS